MCYHKLFIYNVCGHPHWGQQLVPCGLFAASESPSEPRRICTIRQHHPYHTIQFHTLCLSCEQERQRALRSLDSDDSRTSLGFGSGVWSLRSEGRDSKQLGMMRLEKREQSMAERARAGNMTLEREVSMRDAEENSERGELVLGGRCVRCGD